MITLKDFNPDCMSIEDLEELHSQLNNRFKSFTESCEISVNQQFLGENYDKNNKKIMSGIRNYIAVKIAALYSRKAGNIGIALESEKQCDQIYKELPEFAQW